MKNFNYLSLLLMATAAVVTSCSKTDNGVDIENQDKGAPSSMVINFSNPRSTGTPTNESALTGGTVLVFRSASGVLDGMTTFSAAPTNPITVSITAGTRDVYVIANTGINFSSITNVSQLKNFTNKYALSSISATGTSLPMSGATLNVNATSATTASHATATVQMVYMCSKVTIKWDVTQLNANITNFTVKKIYMMNVPTLTDCFATGADNLTSYCTSFATGIGSNFASFDTGLYYPASPTYTNAYAAALAQDPATTSGDNYFYIFENKVAGSPTIAVVEATADGILGETTYYYPIVINGSQNTTGGNNTATIIRGQYYNVTATIKGYGDDNPYNPIVKANMDVTIVPADWIATVNIDETFN